MNKETESPPPDDTAGGPIVETFTNPLADGAVIEDSAPPPDATPPHALDTALMLCEAINVGFTMRYSAPLADSEKAELVTDLAAVLAKHDVPNIPYHEELKLSISLGGMVFRREHERRRAAAMADSSPRGEPAHDSSGSGEKRQRENGVHPQTQPSSGFAALPRVFP